MPLSLTDCVSDRLAPFSHRVAKAVPPSADGAPWEVPLILGGGLRVEGGWLMVDG